MKIQNEALIDLLESFQEDLVETIRDNKLDIPTSVVGPLFEVMLLSYLDAVPVGITDFVEMVQSPEQIISNYNSMHEWEEDPDQAYSDAVQRQFK